MVNSYGKCVKDTELHDNYNQINVMHAAEVTDRLLYEELLETHASMLLHLMPIYHRHCIYTERALTHTHTDLKEPSRSSAHTCNNRCTKTHTGEMSDARPSGPHTAVCHDNHRRTKWTRRDKLQWNGGRQKEWGWRRLRWGSRRSVSWHERDSFYNLSLSSFHAAGAQTLFPHFLPVFVLSALVLSLHPADLPCFESPQTLWPRSEQRELTPSELLPGQFRSAVLKNRKK